MFSVIVVSFIFECFLSLFIIFFGRLSDYQYGLIYTSLHLTCVYSCKNQKGYKKDTFTVLWYSQYFTVYVGTSEKLVSL